MIQELLLFLKRPRFRPTPSSLNQKFRRLLVCLGLYFLVIITLGLFITLYNKLLITQLNLDFAVRIKKNFQNVTGGSNLKMFILLVLLGPVIEELLFRGWFNFKKAFIALATAILFMFILAGVSGTSFYTQPIDGSFWTRVVISVAAGAIVHLLGPTSQLKALGRQHFSKFYYGSSTIFALVHLANYIPLSPLEFLLSLPLITPQLSLGLLFGYIRVKNGLFWSIALHITVNYIPFLFTFSASMGG